VHLLLMCCSCVKLCAIASGRTMRSRKNYKGFNVRAETLGTLCRLSSLLLKIKTKCHLWPDSVENPFGPVLSDPKLYRNYSESTAQGAGWIALSRPPLCVHCARLQISR
jgi:hypothetical protein